MPTWLALLQGTVHWRCLLCLLVSRWQVGRQGWVVHGVSPQPVLKSWIGSFEREKALSVPDKLLVEATSTIKLGVDLKKALLQLHRCTVSGLRDAYRAEYHRDIVKDIAANTEGKAFYSQYVLYMVWWAHNEEWKAHAGEYKMSPAAHKLYLKWSVKLAYFNESQVYRQKIYWHNVIATVLKIILMM